MYRSLKPEKIVATIETLGHGIEAQFPDSGLSRVCQELLAVARESHERSIWIAKPQRLLRVSLTVVVVIILVGLVIVGALAPWPTGGFDLIALVQVSEAALNVILLLSAAIIFLITTESRVKRSKALNAIHELRALAHVIDMHQLTKDPEYIGARKRLAESSPSRKSLSPEQLMNYLDYCSEMLSLIGKLAALYVQDFDDPVALAAVNEVEGLTTSLSGKIWQKILILNLNRESAR